MKSTYLWIASIIILTITLSSSTFKLKNKYEYRSIYDNYYLYFTKKDSFDLQLYSCMYAIKIIGRYKDSQDTLYLNFDSIYEFDRTNKTWNSASLNPNGEYAFNENFIRFINGFRKLHKHDNSRILVPIGINRPFKTPKRAQADNW